MTNWHELDAAATLRKLDTDPKTGLSQTEAARRLAKHGANELSGSATRNPWRILWAQLTSVLVIVLIVTAGVSALLADYKDAAAIGAIVILNAILGFTQEFRAEQAIAALKKLAVPSVRVRREGEVREIEAALLVPGDIVLLGAGNLIPADCRLLAGAGLQTQESALTGESQPVDKNASAIGKPGMGAGDQLNMVWMGTFVVGGRGEAVVTGTGMSTELGRVAALIQDVAAGGNASNEITPLQRRLDQLGRGLAASALAVVALIVVLGLLRGAELRLLLLTAVSLGVAAVPEGLPAVVTIALALGAQRMLKRKALIRNLPAVETLGSVTVICTDKTGTLTENRMTAAVLQLGPDRLSVEGDVCLKGDEPDYRPLLAIGSLCNDTHTARRDKGAALGDPTETALVAAAERFGLAKAPLEALYPRVAEIPFSSERKRMTTIHRVPSDPAGLLFDTGPVASPFIAFTKGAVDGLLERSVKVWVQGKAEPLDQSARERLSDEGDKLALQGMRVLGMAFRGLSSDAANPGETERDLTFAGIVGMIDPPRPEAFGAIAKCKAAGIFPVMITGDHPLTARFIAGRLGIGGKVAVITGAQLEGMSPRDLDSIVDSTQVYARVSPEHKLKIIGALQRRGHVVAMTGDGVNDAPALKKADIGVAMGLIGTDVARGAADMILLDDNFATVVAAVEEGRVIYDNVRKFIRYIVTTNSAEIWVMLAAPLIGMPLPLLPLQILWLNLVTDGLPALALAMEPAEQGLMERPPFRPGESIFARGMGRHAFWGGLIMAFLSLGSGYWLWRAHNPEWQSLLFTVLTFAQMAHVMASRSERLSLFQTGLLSNKPLLAAVSLTVVLQFALLYVPFLQSVFNTRALGFQSLGLSLAVTVMIFLGAEAEKWLVRRQSS